MIVRRATADDAAALTTCIQAAYAPYMSLGLPAVSDGIADDIREHNVWVALVDDKLRGGIVMTMGATAHIANLAVHPDASGHGIGKALIAEAMRAAQKSGHMAIHLATHADMTGTQAFYRRTGWSETGREGNKVYFKRQL